MIKIKVKPVSINDAYYSRAKVLNRKARDYRETFMEQLQSDSNQNILKHIQKEFKKKKHSLRIKFIFQVPRSIFYTKEGTISRKSMDLDNLLKLPMDFLTNSRYNKREFDCGICYNLNIDDQYVTSIICEKSASLDANYHILIDIEVLSLSV